jgi:hypothetical protein
MEVLLAGAVVFVRASLVKKPSRLQGAVICLFFLESDIKRENLGDMNGP